MSGTNRSTGPATVTVTGKDSPGTGSAPSAVMVIRTVTAPAVLITKTLRVGKHGTADLRDNLHGAVVPVGGGSALDASGRLAETLVL